MLGNYQGRHLFLTKFLVMPKFLVMSKKFYKKGKPVEIIFTILSLLLKLLTKSGLGLK